MEDRDRRRFHSVGGFHEKKKNQRRIMYMYATVYCREMHPASIRQNVCRGEVTEALWDAQTFYEKMGALMFGQAFVYGSREVVVRPFTVYEEGFRETPEEFATTYSISGTLLRCYDLLNDFMPGEEEAQEEAEGLNNEMYRLVLKSAIMHRKAIVRHWKYSKTRSFNDLKKKM